MRISQLLILILTLNFQLSFSQRCDLLDHWTIQKSEAIPFAMQHDLFFLNKNTGYSVGVAGSMKITKDGGTTWNILHKNKQSGTNAILKSVYFIDDQIGFVAGEGEDHFVQNIHTDAVFMKTKNGGVSWDKKIIEGINRIHDIKFYDELNGIGLFWSNEREDLVSRTNDGGKTWFSVPTELSSFKIRKIIKAGKFDMLCGQNSEYQAILMTLSETGEVIESHPLPSNNIFNLYFINEKIGFADNKYKTTDGGVSWTGIDFPQFNSLIHFKDENHGFLLNILFELETDGWGCFQRVVGIETFETSDGGRSWKSRKSSNACIIEGINHSPVNDVIYYYGSGFEGKIEFNYNSGSGLQNTPEAFLFPIPCFDHLLIEGDFPPDSKIEIYSSDGKLIHKSEFNFTIKTDYLLPGFYTLKIIHPAYSKSRFHKFIKH